MYGWLKGVGFGVRHNLEVMEEEGVKPERLFLATGGGTKNSMWMQMVSWHQLKLELLITNSKSVQVLEMLL